VTPEGTSFLIREWSRINGNGKAVEPETEPDKESIEVEEHHTQERDETTAFEMGEEMGMEKELAKDHSKHTRDLVLRLTVGTYPRLIEQLDFLKNCWGVTTKEEVIICMTDSYFTHEIESFDAEGGKDDV
jgi:hypothetical protein